MNGDAAGRRMLEDQIHAVPPLDVLNGMRTIDPVAEPQAYQQLLLSLLGDDDPAEAQAATPGIIRALIEEAGDDLVVRPEPSEWSALLCIAHITDAEIVYSGRYRWIVAHDGPDLIGYDQDRWVDRLHPHERDASELLAVLEPLRAANIALWRRTAPDDRARAGIHRERGPESFDLSFRLIAGHDRSHLAQARQALAAVRASRGSG